MKRTFCKITALCMCVAMLFVSFMGCQNNQDGKNNNDNEKPKVTTPNQTEPPAPDQPEISLDGEFIIGLSAPMTGPAAIYGRLISNGAKLAVDQINANGGIYGAELKLEIADDKGEGSTAEINYSILKDKGMHVSLGAVTSNALVRFATAADQDDMFILSTSSSDMSSFDDVYQLCFSDAGTGEAAARYVNTLDVKKVGILYQSDDDYSITLCNSFKQALEKDINIAESAFTYYDDDFTDNAQALKDSELIFMCTYDYEASSFMNAAKGVLADDAIYFGNALDSLENMNTYSIPQKIIYTSEFDKDSTKTKNAKFIESYAELYDETPNAFSALGYDGVYAIAGAIKAAIDDGEELSPQTSSKDICKALKEQFDNGFKFSGVTGSNISWTPSGSAVKEAFIITVKDFGIPA